MSEFNAQKTAVIIVDHGSVKEESNRRLHEFVDLFRQRTSYQTVQPAHMELAAPTILNAFQECQKQAVGLVVVSPFFLLPGKHWQKDIPALSAEASRSCGNIPFFVSAPLGVHEMLVEVMNSRIEQCALLHKDSEQSNLCNCCSEQYNCKTQSTWPD